MVMHIEMKKLNCLNERAALGQKLSIIPMRLSH